MKRSDPPDSIVCLSATAAASRSDGAQTGPSSSLCPWPRKRSSVTGPDDEL
jgi:hypothetical protein